MSRLCVIIGFTYSENEQLISSSIDMFTVFNFFSNRGFEVVVLSDILYHPRPIVESIFKGKVSDEIYSFLPSLPLGREPLMNISWVEVNTLHSLMTNLRQLHTQDVTKLVIYYTGHSETGGRIVLPDNNTVVANVIRDEIVSKCSDETEILSVFDTCFVGHGDYPFILKDDRFILRSPGMAMSHSIIHLSSSMSNEKSASDITHSLFTSFLFERLSKNSLRLDDLMKQVQSKITTKAKGRKSQTVACASSFDRQPVLYSWLLPSGIGISVTSECVTVSTT